MSVHELCHAVSNDPAVRERFRREPVTVVEEYLETTLNDEQRGRLTAENWANAPDWELILKVCGHRGIPLYL